MDARSFAIVAAAALCLGAPAAAEPAGALPAPKAEQPKAIDTVTLKPADIEVQLAERVEAKSPAIVAKRPRAARVTTCRCGDPASSQ
jgi:hypothetical protein